MMWITTLLILLPALWMAWLFYAAPVCHDDDEGRFYKH